MDTREEFEKLPEIASHLHNVFFDKGGNEYLPKKMGYIIHEFSAYFLNGAWYKFQEQQKKIDAIKNKLSAIYDASDENETVAHLLDDILELLK